MHRRLGGGRYNNQQLIGEISGCPRLVHCHLNEFNKADSKLCLDDNKGCCHLAEFNQVDNDIHCHLIPIR